EAAGCVHPPAADAGIVAAGRVADAAADAGIEAAGRVVIAAADAGEIAVDRVAEARQEPARRGELVLRTDDEGVRARAVARVRPEANVPRLVVADDQVAEVGAVVRHARAAPDVDVD